MIRRDLGLIGQQMIDWKTFLSKEFEKPYGIALKDFVRAERAAHNVFPSPENTLLAFKKTEFRDIKAVILGQDPYHGTGQATGLAFAVGTTITPPSLRNIFSEYSSDLGAPTPTDLTLNGWANSGILLLNTTLTVRENSPMSHTGRGWETLTASAIKAISDELDGVVFILWGRHATGHAEGLIDTARHMIITSAHPSPLSAYRGFFGSKPFSKANSYRLEHKKTPIDWVLN
jgi:uracil-DNA glycosylase